MNAYERRAIAVCIGVFLVGAMAASAFSVEPIPNRIVVLTFDDSVRSQFTVVRPILKQYGFGATFFITEGFDFPRNKKDYMTWDQIAQLSQDGFEIGNHTRDHMPVTAENLKRLAEQLEAINRRCTEHGIPRPVSFAYPGNAFDLGALPILAQAGIRYARRGTEPELPYEAGRGLPYQPGLDHPLLIPTAGDARPTWTIDNLVRAVRLGRGGQIAVLQFHGVPDLAHPWVNTPLDQFKKYMQYLADHHYTVIAMRDLAKYVPANCVPTDPQMVITDRKNCLARGGLVSNYRQPKGDRDLKDWLTNMLAYHHFSPAEMVAATGMKSAAISAAIDRFGLRSFHRPKRRSTDRLTVLPYPGGRHPRLGYRDAEIRPQRETKCSVFLSWNPDDYVVLDIPEAIWIDGPKKPELLYLAHTHIPTIWDRQGVELPKLEWTRGPEGQLTFARTLPNGIQFGTRIRPNSTRVNMEMWITNGTDKTLTGLRVQNCVMLGHADGFNQQTNDNKLFQSPLAACHNPAKNRWIITAWQPCWRPWGNPSSPCMHSDPQFPDCKPGETQRVTGYLAFYSGTDIQSELKRLSPNRQHGPKKGRMPKRQTR